MYSISGIFMAQLYVRLIYAYYVLLQNKIHQKAIGLQHYMGDSLGLWSNCPHVLVPARSTGYCRDVNLHVGHHNHRVFKAFPRVKGQKGVTHHH